MPEFLPTQSESPVASLDSDQPIAAKQLLEPISVWPSLERLSPQDHRDELTPSQSRRRASRLGWLVFAVVLAVLAALGWRYRTDHPKTPLDSFWNPALHDQAVIPVCIGGSVFSQTHTSGVATATKDVDYPFISIQSASAAAQISGFWSGAAEPQPNCRRPRQLL